ncbi:MAG: response regulator [Nitrospira sp.]|nr:response regulator [Nitrospira sp.]
MTTRSHTTQCSAETQALLPLKLLIVEDRETDTELIIRELKKHGYDPTWVRVDTEEEFLRQVQASVDLITVDAIMPQFSAKRVLTLLQEHQLDIPCIIISGSIGEEEAVALIRAGAVDYLMKDRLGRLGQSVRYVLDQHHLRTEHRQAHQSLVTLNAELERRIAERTAKLEEVNQQLAQELEERKQVELRLRQHEAMLERHVAARTIQLERSHVRLRRLVSELTLVEQRERKQLASELHDYLAQLLVVAKLKIDQLSHNPSSDHTARMICEARSSLDQALTYSRTLVAQLSPTVLFTQGLVAALQWLPEYFSMYGLRVHVQSSVSSVILAEDQSVLLFQSARELLFNVLKHAGTGEATVGLDILNEQTLRITVADRGVGFDARNLGGETKGFGLFSIRERIEGLNGTVSVQSSPDTGTQIEISVPCSHSDISSDPHGPMDDITNPLSDIPPLSGTCRVVIVDDHTLVRKEMCQLLSTIQGVTVIGEASDGKQGVELATTLDPDLVLMDINMPGLNGIEATKQILAHNPAVKVIGVTVNTERDIHARMLAVGAVACLAKDSLSHDLQPTISRILKQAHHMAQPP